MKKLSLTKIWFSNSILRFYHTLFSRFVHSLLRFAFSSLNLVYLILINMIHLQSTRFFGFCVYALTVNRARCIRTCTPLPVDANATKLKGLGCWSHILEDKPKNFNCLHSICFPSLPWYLLLTLIVCEGCSLLLLLLLPFLSINVVY